MFNAIASADDTPVFFLMGGVVGVCPNSCNHLDLNVHRLYPRLRIVVVYVLNITKYQVVVNRYFLIFFYDKIKSPCRVLSDRGEVT